MLSLNSYEELAHYVETQQTAFFFTADWCGDCRFIKPMLPDIEAVFPEIRFVEVDRDKFRQLSETWNVWGIPSLIVTEKGQEVGRLVNKKRKTKEEICSFLTSLS